MFIASGGAPTFCIWADAETVIDAKVRTTAQPVPQRAPCCRYHGNLPFIFFLPADLNSGGKPIIVKLSKRLTDGPVAAQIRVGVDRSAKLRRDTLNIR
jgi:hypothetical protein